MITESLKVQPFQMRTIAIKIAVA